MGAGQIISNNGSIFTFTMGHNFITLHRSTCTLSAGSADSFSICGNKVHVRILGTNLFSNEALIFLSIVINHRKKPFLKARKGLNKSASEPKNFT